MNSEDIVVIKAVFDRAQDWADIEAVCKLQGRELDLAYLIRWLGQIIGLEDPRVERLAGLVEGA